MIDQAGDDAGLIPDFVQVALVKADGRRRDLADQRQHRRIHPVGGQQRSARVEQARPRHHGVGLRLAGRQSRPQRHIGGALFVAGMDDRRESPGTGESVEQVVIMDAGQGVDGVDAVGEQSGNRGLAGGHSANWHSPVWPVTAVLRRLFAVSSTSTLRHPDTFTRADALWSLSRLTWLLALTKPSPPMRFSPPKRLREGRRARSNPNLNLLPEQPQNVHAPLPLTYLRRAARKRYRPGASVSPAGATASVTMVGVLFIDLRDHYGLTQVVADPDSPAFKAGRNAARRNGWCGSTARCASARRAPRTRICRPARSRSSSPRSKCWAPPANCRCRCSAIRNIRKTCGSSTASSTCAASSCTTTSCCAAQIIDSLRTRMKAGGFFEFQTPILTASSPEGARLSGAVAHSSRQVLRAAAGAAAVQAAHHGGRLRPLFPDRAVLPRRGCARRPFAGRILSARSRDELRHPAGRVRCGRAGDCAACSRNSATARR